MKSRGTFYGISSGAALFHCQIINKTMGGGVKLTGLPYPVFLDEKHIME